VFAGLLSLRHLQLTLFSTRSAATRFAHTLLLIQINDYASREGLPYAIMAFDCSTVPDSVNTDAGVAGAGTLLSFIITNFLSFLLSGAIILLGLRKSTSAPISRKLLQSFSDQQILTGIGIQSVGLAKMKSMVPYHFFIIWLLSLLSTATNLVTLLALVNDYKRDWVLRWIRQILMMVNMFLGIL
jgi:hypothetical protein